MQNVSRSADYVSHDSVLEIDHVEVDPGFPQQADAELMKHHPCDCGGDQEIAAAVHRRRRAEAVYVLHKKERVAAEATHQPPRDLDIGSRDQRRRELDARRARRGAARERQRHQQRGQELARHVAANRNDTAGATARVTDAKWRIAWIGDVFDGAAETIARCRPVLYVEWIKLDQTTLASRIAGFGYDIHVNGGNLLCVPTEMRERLKVNSKPPAEGTA